MITVNKFFAHWVKEISIKKFSTNKELIPTTTSQEIYQYSDSMLKHLPKKYLEVIRNNFLYSEKPVVLKVGIDKRIHGVTRDNKRTDDHLDGRIAKFKDQIKNKYVYRIPLKYICDIGKINFLTKIDMKIRLTLATDFKKLFE